MRNTLYHHAFRAKEKKSKQDRENTIKKRKAEAKVKATRRRTEFDFDLWDEEAGQGDKSIAGNEWLEETTKLVNLRGTRSHRPKLPSDLLRPTSELKSVEEPHGGESYNPSLKDHQDLMWKAAMVEMNKEKEQKKVEFHTTRLFRNAPVDLERTKLEEMSQGIHELNGAKDEESDKEVDDGEEEEGVAKVNAKPKTKKQRRKELERKRQELKVKRQKSEKSKSHDLFHLKSLKKEIKGAEELVAANMAKKASKKALKMRQTLQLSSMKFAEPDIDLKLSDEITGNLRNLKPEGNLLEDRFKSLQKRNIIETRVKHKVVRNRKNRKRVLKRSHKMGFSWEKN